MNQLRKVDHEMFSKLTPHRNIRGSLISEVAGHIDYKGRVCNPIIVESQEDKIEM